MKTLKEQAQIGIGLRSHYYDEVLSGSCKDLGFLEAITENYFQTKGRPFHTLEKVRADFPLASHGVSMNIGSIDPVDKSYLKDMKEFVDAIQPEVVSDHLCWTGAHQKNWYDLYPLPMTEESIKNCVDKIQQIQDFLGRSIAIENTSSYLRFEGDEMDEHEFINEILKKADCQLLLDVNNVYVNAFNHSFDAKAYIENIPADRVKQYHLAGHTQYESFIFDTHDQPIIDEVWKLYEHTIHKIGPRPTLIERDDNFPKLSEVLDEAQKAKAIMDNVLRTKNNAA